MSALRTFAAVLLLPASVGAAPFPTRQGETGLLDVPDAEVVGRGSTLLGAELRFDRVPGTPNGIGPFPLALAVGLGRMDVGFALREWGRPGDPRPSPLLMTAALKVQLLAPGESLFGFAIDATLDRFNRGAVPALRLVASTRDLGRIRVAGYGGVEGHGPRPYAIGPAAGLATSVLLGGNLETVLQGTYSPQGTLWGGAFRWKVAPNMGLSVGLDWLPRDRGFRAGLGFGFEARKPPPRRAVVEPPPPVPPAPPEPPAAPVFGDDRPRLRLRIHPAEIPGVPRRRHLQIGPLPAEGAPPPKAAAPPSPEEARRARFRENSALLDARDKRLLAAASDLAAREQGLAARTAALDERERQLSAIQEQLLARERQLGRTRPADDAERLLESQEGRSRATEQRLAGQERTLGAAGRAAAGREHSAAARESSLRAEAERLAAAAAREKQTARQEAIRARALSTRERQLAAREERHVAWRQRLDAMEAEQRSRTERLDARQGRLGDFRRRLDLVATRVAAAKGPAAAVRAPARRRPAGSFIVVIKPPASIVRAAPAAAAGATSADRALHPGVAVEKAVAAATVVYFKTPDQTMGELDRETVQSVARLAARERCELMVWARAQSPALMAEAARRAEELKQLAARAAGVDPRQIVTRITVRPAATGVDVVVSALREQAAPAAAVPGGPATPGGAVPGPEPLREGETARRQVRDAIVKYQGDIEGCVGEELERRPRLPRTEELLKLSVAAQGGVSDLRATSAELAGGELEKCLRGASAGWRFPESDTAYEVDIPITVVGAGAKP